MKDIIKYPAIFYLLFFVLFTCKSDPDGYIYDDFYRQEMRQFVKNISQYAKYQNSYFIIIPQNGQELVIRDEEPAYDYLYAIDAVGREDLFYGFYEDNLATPEIETEYLTYYLDICLDNGVSVLVTDYCWDLDKVDSSYYQNASRGYISFAAPYRELFTIPSYPAEPFNVNYSDVFTIFGAENFLYLINPEYYASKEAFLLALQSTDYDIIIMDAFFDDTIYTSAEIEQLKTKNNGGERKIIAYMSIGEAEDYRYYWQDSWLLEFPEWLAEENPDWQGNYKVRYWYSQWQEIIYGNDSSYIKRIIDAGFDGAYLDIIDAFEYFE